MESYPLHWPAHYPRCMVKIHSPFDRNLTFDRSRKELKAEVRRMGGLDIILSTNLPLRLDGEPRADAYRREMDDPGAAVYFEYRGKPMSFACDLWVRLDHNMRSIAKTIEAIRGIERWGSSEMMQRAFTGFQVLPAPPSPYEVLGLSEVCTPADVKDAYRRLAAQHHPDRGGSQSRMSEINAAYESLQKGTVG